MSLLQELHQAKKSRWAKWQAVAAASGIVDYGYGMSPPTVPVVADVQAPKKIEYATFRLDPGRHLCWPEKRHDEPVVIVLEPVDPAHSVKIDRIARIVAEYYDISMIDLCGERKTTAVVRPRQVVMYLARHMTTRSMPVIGHHIGGRDHTTVLHGVHKITELMATDEKLRLDVEFLRAKILASAAS